MENIIRDNEYSKTVRKDTSGDAYLGYMTDTEVIDLVRSDLLAELTLELGYVPAVLEETVQVGEIFYNKKRIQVTLRLDSCK